MAANSFTAANEFICHIRDRKWVQANLGFNPPKIKSLHKDDGRIYMFYAWICWEATDSSRLEFARNKSVHCVDVRGEFFRVRQERNASGTRVPFHFLLFKVRALPCLSTTSGTIPSRLRQQKKKRGGEIHNLLP